MWMLVLKTTCCHWDGCNETASQKYKLAQAAKVWLPHGISLEMLWGKGGRFSEPKQLQESTPKLGWNFQQGRWKDLKQKKSLREGHGSTFWNTPTKMNKINTLTCKINYITFYNDLYLNIISGMPPVSFRVQISKFKLWQKIINM